MRVLWIIRVAKNINFEAEHGKPLIPATQEAEVGGSLFEARSGQKQETLSEK
jgi:hypothetical protein